LALAVSVLGKNLGIRPSSRGKVAQEFREAEFEAVRSALQDDPEEPAQIEEKSDEN
jgi:hypothetical protein